MACSSCSRRAVPRTDIPKVNNLRPNVMPPNAQPTSTTTENVTPIIDMVAATTSAMTRMFRKKN